MKRWMFVVLGIACVLAIGFVVTGYFVKSTSNWAKTLTWEDPSLKQVADGVYTGTARLDLPVGTAAANSRATVRVTVKDHRYRSIEVTAPREIAKGMTEYAQMVIRSQSLKPDVISGGTVTKSLVLMAAANALTDR
jgi:uncharacterized protein with FMN-binding domain